jgi:hypothetical protein
VLDNPQASAGSARDERFDNTAHPQKQVDKAIDFFVISCGHAAPIDAVADRPTVRGATEGGQTGRANWTPPPARSMMTEDARATQQRSEPTIASNERTISRRHAEGTRQHTGVSALNLWMTG